MGLLVLNAWSMPQTKLYDDTLYSSFTNDLLHDDILITMGMAKCFNVISKYRNNFWIKLGVPLKKLTCLCTKSLTSTITLS